MTTARPFSPPPIATTRVHMSIDNAQEIVRTPTPDERLALTLDQFMGQSSYWSSIDPSTEAGKSLIWSAREGAVDGLSASLGESLEIQHLLLHPVTITRDTGEEIALIRAVIISPDGTCRGSCSTGIIGSIRTMVQLYGTPPWTPPKMVKMVRVPLSGGRQTFKLQPLPLAVTGGGKAKK